MRVCLDTHHVGCCLLGSYLHGAFHHAPRDVGSHNEPWVRTGDLRREICGADRHVQDRATFGSLDRAATLFEGQLVQVAAEDLEAPVDDEGVVETIRGE